MDMGLQGRTVVVTGGSGGIGRGIVAGFAREGAYVASVDIDAGDDLVAAAQAEGVSGWVAAFRADITQRDAVETLAEAIRAEFGQPISVLVNNAGGGTQPRAFAELTLEDRRWQQALNEDAFINMIQVMSPDMMGLKKGAIVNIASNAALLGSKYQVYYSGMKGFMISATRALAREWGATGVRVNAIAPGWIVPYEAKDAGPNSHWNKFSFKIMGTPEEMQQKMETGNLFNMPDLPIPRLGRPEDIANLSVFLASDVSGYLTGQTISVSGGAAMH